MESKAQERNEITVMVSKAYLKFHSLLPNIGSQNQEVRIIWALGKSPPVCTHDSNQALLDLLPPNLVGSRERGFTTIWKQQEVKQVKPKK